MTPAIHQFHAGAAVGDAVTNAMLLTRTLLRELGFQSEIYVRQLPEAYRGELKSLESHQSSPGDLLLVHHSMGHDDFEWVLSRRERKVLVYHNITPPEHLKDPFYQRYSRLGREQLRALREVVVASYADSRFNALELEELGFPDPVALPLLVDTAQIRNHPWLEQDPVPAAGEAPFTLLFVGRLVRNKCVHDVIEAFAAFSHLSRRPAQLVLIGSDGDTEYVQELREHANRLGVAASVRFLGKVPSEVMYGWYRRADAFLTLSEHEGFCVPLVEAMVFGVPIFAFNSTSIPYTLDGAGVLFSAKDPSLIGATLVTVDEDRALRRRLIEGQRRRLEDFSPPAIRAGLVKLLQRLGATLAQQPEALPAPPAPRWQLEGPFDSSYSLALVNRELAFALERREPGSAALFSTEGPGDFNPSEEGLSRFEGLERLWRRAKKRSGAEVVVRNLYPPRVADMDGLLNVFYFAWEESTVPAPWVAAFNRHLDGLCVLSGFVKKVLIDSGVRVPITVGGCGIEQLDRQPRRPYPGALGKKFKFLHISSAFPRKGVDVLLRAFERAFTAADPVSLVIKTFPNPHNRVAEDLRALRASNPRFPDVVLIDQDLEPGEIQDLYLRCDAFVAPSRGEGFGLPMAEAMHLGIPVITTGFGGQRDFCDEQTARLVDYRFAWSRSHFGQFSSVWADPVLEDLAAAMRELYLDPSSAQVRVQAARRRIASEFTWDRCAQRLGATVEGLRAVEPLWRRKVKVGWVSSWNTKCGIATYSQFLLEQFDPEEFEVRVFASRGDPLGPDAPNVRRCWNDWTQPLEQLEAAVLEEGIEVLVFQFNFGFFGVQQLGALLERLRARGVRTVITFHSTKDVTINGTFVSLRQIQAALAGVDRLLVHSVVDLNRLKEFGLVDNVTLLPHGVHHRPVRDPEPLRRRLGLPGDRKVIATYGFLLPHKGVERLIAAMPELLARVPEAHLLLVNALYPIEWSSQLKARCEELIARLGLAGRVTLITDFLEDEQSAALLEAAELVVYPYEQTAESASGAVRFGLGANRPVVVTPLEIFSDVEPVVHTLPGTDGQAIASGLAELLLDPARARARHEAQQRWLAEHAWPGVSRRLQGMLEALANEARLGAAVGGVVPQLRTKHG